MTAGGWAELPDRERSLISAARLVVGGRRLLDGVPLAPGQRAAELPRQLRAGLPRLLDGAGPAVVLASGDPLLSGIGSTLIDLLGADRVRVHPAVSSVALARARLGWPAESTVTLSLVGRPIDLVRRVLAPGARLVLLSSDRRTPAAVAGVLAEEGYGGSRMVVLGDLGTPHESRREDDAAQLIGDAPQLNVVGVECRAGEAPVRGWVAGLPDDAYEHDGQLTKRDVRAAVLARLAPRPGELLWDLGAGAGSVAVEWCRADPRCRAVAVERDQARADRIGRNAARLGVPELTVIRADTTDEAVLAELPAPSAVFIGGGADPELLDRCWARLRTGGRLVVTAVTVETEQLLLAAAARRGGELTRIATEELQPLGRFRGWVPARPVVIWSVTKAALA
jgi:precorrin-6Y C5,15-methyltransferase (decarboxylating)